jgi:hypothetical protein
MIALLIAIVPPSSDTRHTAARQMSSRVLWFELRPDLQ